jgi:hypothetical protein
VRPTPFKSIERAGQLAKGDEPGRGVFSSLRHPLFAYRVGSSLNCRGAPVLLSGTVSPSAGATGGVEETQ